jgi:D-glycero-alpha-D-manno-heptose-7-phosphate kinase
MIISRTPFRMSFFGGGTDYPVWFREHGGAVLATTIDKYCYISCRRLPPFFEHRSRIAYSRIELVKNNEEIEHPAVRGVLKYLNINDGLEIHHDGDLPARTGLGSSSSFTVGLLHTLYALQHIMPSKDQLAQAAIHVEQNVLGRSRRLPGSSARGAWQSLQGHVFSERRDRAYPDHHATRPACRLSEPPATLLHGFSRIASEVAREQIDRTSQRTAELFAMLQMVEEGIAILTGGGDLAAFGTLLHEGWMLKRRLTSRITTPAIDEIYTAARAAGALGGKLLGAGGGGFMLLFAKPEDHERIRRLCPDCYRFRLSLKAWVHRSCFIRKIISCSTTCGLTTRLIRPPN